MNKKALVAIGFGVILFTSILGVINLNPSSDVNDRIKDMEMRREQKLDVIDSASVSWQQNRIDDRQFIEIIDQSIIDTDALREEYLALNLPATYDKYKELSINSLDRQKEAFLKLREYVLTEEPDVQKTIRAEFDELIISSFEFRRDALRELNNM